MKDRSLKCLNKSDSLYYIDAFSGEILFCLSYNYGFMSVRECVWSSERVCMYVHAYVRMHLCTSV